MYVVAIGAEIPDTIQSVAVARRGYGAHALLLTPNAHPNANPSLLPASNPQLTNLGKLPTYKLTRLTRAGSMAVSNSCGSQIINILGKPNTNPNRNPNTNRNPNPNRNPDPSPNSNPYPFPSPSPNPSPNPNAHSSGARPTVVHHQLRRPYDRDQGLP
jgi:hypothetical protein